MSASEYPVVIVAVNGKQNRDIYHTDPDCIALSMAKDSRRVERVKLYDDAEECAYCSGEYTNATADWDTGECQTCGDVLDENGECPFCSEFDSTVPADLEDNREWNACASCGLIVWGPATDEDVYCEDCR